jgi:hypothetical protein
MINLYERLVYDCCDGCSKGQVYLAQGIAGENSTNVSIVGFLSYHTL